MRKVILFAICATFVVARAHAGLLTLDGDNINWDINANPTVSPNWTLAVTNNTVNDPEGLSTWQVRMSIVPRAGATGTLQFNSAIVSSTNYILEGHSTPFSQDPGDGGILRGDLGDFVNTSFGAQVPVAGKNLLDIKFSSPNLSTLSGTFDLFAWNGSANSIWGESTTAQPRGFVGLSIANPNGIPVLALGTVVITVPEPGTLAFCTVFGLGGLLILHRRQRRALQQRERGETVDK